MKVSTLSNFVIICFLLFLQIQISSQAPDTLWTKIYGGEYTDNAFSIDITSDSGYIFVGGMQTSFFGNPYLWMVSTNINGDTLWTKTLNDGTNLVGRCIRQLPNDDYIIVAQGTIDSIQGYYLIKFNPFGDPIWTKFLGEANINSLDLTNDGGFIFIGTDYPNGILLRKVNNYGDTLWTKVIKSGIPHQDGGFGVKQASDGGFILAGLNGEIVGGWIIKTDSLGNIKWDLTFDYSGENSELYSIVQDVDSNYVVLGRRWGTSGGGVWVVKVDTIGRTYWSKRYYGSFGYSIIETNDNNFLVLGYNNNNIILYKLDTYGDTLWSKVIENISINDFGNYLLQNSDGSFIILGTVNYTPSREDDAILIKLGSDILNFDDENHNVVSKYELAQNYPNPFNPSTTINFKIPEISFVTLKVYDVLGIELETLVNEERPVGHYEITWYSENLPNGVYFYRLQAGSFIETRKMVLLK